VFINFADNSRLDGQGFAAFGQVTSGMNVVDALFSGYARELRRVAGLTKAASSAKGTLT
jgi:peptidyl-prolyl cis-trans isomerase A (cyclophilin A)